ncbi:hypothetical protein BDV95DRAFT_654385 [Massariosphaeria phaeospora]|uniref:F-box domain-containing protein n=1 Tax=Massariosphaeria phaeospora TaxID=100035 RepID=A0A7C8MDI9_9PLEO|nr:hypothetical protein BDV95DRAFT_654385 [Massariosphaeria phaeospora]
MTQPNRLPEELLLQIAESLEDDKPTLNSFSQASRQANRVSTNILYRSIAVGGGCAPDDAELILLVRTLLYHKQFVPKIKALTIKSFAYELEPDDPDPFSSQTPYRQGISSWLSVDNPSFMEKCKHFISIQELLSGTRFPHWRIAIENGIQPAFIGILLAMTPNVTDLHLDIKEDSRTLHHDYSPISNILGIPVQLALPYRLPRWSFARVTRLRVTEPCLAIMQVGMPQLTTLEIDLMSTDLFSLGLEWPRQLRPCQALRSILFRVDWQQLSGEIGAVSLTSIFQRLHPTRLTTIDLTFELGPETEYTSGLVPLGSFEYLAVALRDVSSTVEDLCISITPNRDVFPIEYLWTYDPILDLAEFKRLRRLSVPQQALIHRDIGKRSFANPVFPTFPESLESLEIFHPDTKVIPWLELLVSEKSSKTPNLTSITIFCDWDWDWAKNPSLDMSGSIVDQYKCEGVNLSLVERLAKRNNVIELKETSVWDADWADEDWAESIFG